MSNKNIFPKSPLTSVNQSIETKDVYSNICSIYFKSIEFISNSRSVQYLLNIHHNSIPPFCDWFWFTAISNSHLHLDILITLSKFRLLILVAYFILKLAVIFKRKSPKGWCCNIKCVKKLRFILCGFRTNV